MFIICSGKTSDVLSELCMDDLGVPVMGVSLKDLVLTIKNRGSSHFDKVLKVIVTDGALESLVDANEIMNLNQIAQLKGEVLFLNRFSHVTNTKQLSEKIIELPVDEILLSDIKELIGGKE